MFRIGYEKSAPSAAKIDYYNKIAGIANLGIDWVEAAVEPDAVLLTGRENFHALHKEGYSFLVSENAERRLVALFSPKFIAESAEGDKVEKILKLAADFEWQAIMIASFIVKALPRKSFAYKVETITVHESFDQRLSAVIDGSYDAGIFSLADLDTVQNPGIFSDPIKSSRNPDLATLSSLQKMVLPLFECPPAFFQGTTGLMFKDSNSSLVSELSSARKAETVNRFLDELMLLNKHGSDDVGVFSADLPAVSFTYLAGLRDGKLFEDWEMPLPVWEGKNLFATTEHMKDFFGYRFYEPDTNGKQSVSFLASHKVAHSEQVIRYLEQQRVWAAGTRTWYEMAKKGIWVEGTADGIGLGMLRQSWRGDFLSIGKDDVEILTNTESAVQWQQEGWAAQGVYDLVPELPPAIIEQIATTEVVFWTSFQQYQACKEHLAPGLIHATPAGKTAELLKDLQPFVFPSIKAFRFYQEAK